MDEDYLYRIDRRIENEHNNRSAEAQDSVRASNTQGSTLEDAPPIYKENEDDPDPPISDTNSNVDNAPSTSSNIGMNDVSIPQSQLDHSSKIISNDSKQKVPSQYSGPLDGFKRKLTLFGKGKEKKKPAPSDSNNMDTLENLLQLYPTIELHIREKGRGFFVYDGKAMKGTTPKYSYSIQQQRTGFSGQILSLHPGYPSPDGEYGPMLLKGLRNREYPKGGIEIRQGNEPSSSCGSQFKVIPAKFSRSLLNSVRSFDLPELGISLKWSFTKRGVADMKCVDERDQTLIALWESEIKGSLNDMDPYNMHWRLQVSKLGRLQINRAYASNIEVILLTGLLVEEEKLSQFSTFAYHRVLQFLPPEALDATWNPMLSGIGLFRPYGSDYLDLIISRTRNDSYQVTSEKTNPPKVMVDIRKASLSRQVSDYWRYEITDKTAPEAQPIICYRCVGARESIYEYADGQSTVLVSYRGSYYFQTPREEFAARWVGNLNMRLVDLRQGLVIGEFRYVGISLKRRMGVLRLNCRYQAFLDIICATAINATEVHIFETNHQAGMMAASLTPAVTNVVSGF